MSYNTDGIKQLLKILALEEYYWGDPAKATQYQKLIEELGYQADINDLINLVAEIQQLFGWEESQSGDFEED